MEWFLDTRVAGSGSDLRHQVMDYLQRHGDPADDFAGAEITISELLSNVERHTEGVAWVSLTWSGTNPLLSVQDLGPGFDLQAALPEDHLSVGGRGLFLADRLSRGLAVRRRSHRGSHVSATLPVNRPTAADLDPPRHRIDALPAPDEARPDGGFGREPFLRALVVQLAASVEEQRGPDAAEAAVAQVGIDVGGSMENEYRAAAEVVGHLSAQQLAECYVRLKHAIDGAFYVIEVSDDRIVLGNDRCPFGDVVTRAPSLCRMTSSVFGGIAAANRDDGAAVLLEERIAVGDPGCRVVIDLAPGSHAPNPAAHHYRSPAAGTPVAEPSR
ncbi:methanogen output domain 1-containing protein [Rhabdothermincola salaria]|uniref:methanogen output domain 1-containing protein n=1 Tax=Rhabdothermincola salaria TaxID=2903142 RepID=UPI001E589B57|nr:methanogen output domain 1-containing protein [Rhabdothermincola salaria]MCD9624496.1 methanogen output domain 1-containing protein [Rhabdothermincola salaria]